MKDIATCAGCGTKAELCNSVRMSGIKQPRFCKECVLDSMKSDEWKHNDIYWMLQIQELQNMETIDKIKENINGKKNAR